jgi:hypothetical protein
VASAVLAAARRNPALLPVTPEAWALYLLQRAAPSLSHTLVSHLQGLFERGRGGKP